MTTRDLLPSWGRILTGRKPLLSVELTSECPLRCPGCYAYEPGHLSGSQPLRTLADYRGQDLVDAFLALVRDRDPVHVSIVGGEPLVRFRELDAILPALESMSIEVQLVTSAVRPIPRHWNALANLHLVVSVDGLREEHDRRRSPATYDRILKHIEGHRLIVHCTVTRNMLRHDGYLEDFCEWWSRRPEVRKIWFSLFTPQEDVRPEEWLPAAVRKQVISGIASLRWRFPKLYAPDVVLKGFMSPPESPSDCIFAQTTECVSADLKTRISPCQLGGRPDCRECGCIASAGLAAIGRYKIAGLLPVSSIFAASFKAGLGVRSVIAGMPR